MLSVGVRPSCRFGRAREARGRFGPVRERPPDPAGTGLLRSAKTPGGAAVPAEARGRYRVSVAGEPDPPLGPCARSRSRSRLGGADPPPGPAAPGKAAGPDAGGSCGAPVPVPGLAPIPFARPRDFSFPSD